MKTSRSPVKNRLKGENSLCFTRHFGVDLRQTVDLHFMTSLIVDFLQTGPTLRYDVQVQKSLCFEHHSARGSQQFTLESDCT